MNENDLRDCFAMLAIAGFLNGHEFASIATAKEAYRMADFMLEARKQKDEIGIVAVKRGRKKNEEGDA